MLCGCWSGASPLPAGLQIPLPTPNFQRTESKSKPWRKNAAQSNYRKGKKKKTGTEKQSLDTVIRVLRNLSWKKTKAWLQAHHPSANRDQLSSPQQTVGIKPRTRTRAQIPQSWCGTNMTGPNPNETKLNHEDSYTNHWGITPKCEQPTPIKLQDLIYQELDTY